jgi:hypothetical protein
MTTLSVGALGGSWERDSANPNADKMTGTMVRMMPSDRSIVTAPSMETPLWWTDIAPFLCTHGNGHVKSIGFSDYADFPDFADYSEIAQRLKCFPRNDRVPVGSNPP